MNYYDEKNRSYNCPRPKYGALQHCMNAHALFTLLGSHVGVFNALERLIADYIDDCRW
jgi:hypothetical protein